MGTLLTIKTNMQWPLGQVFQVEDEFNSHQRGSFYFRDAYGEMHGPFHHAAEAQHHLQLVIAQTNRV